MNADDISWTDALINAWFDFESFYFPECPMVTGSGCDASGNVVASAIPSDD